MNKSENKAIERVPTELIEPLRFWDDLLRPSRFFEDFFRRGSPGSEARFLSPSVDVEETEDEYQVCVDLPGFKKDDIRVDCTDNQVSISAEKSEEETKRRSTRRYHGSFCRTFSLPQGVSSDDVKADYENGVLTVHIPRGEETKSRRVEIGTGSGERPISTKSGTKETESRPTH